MEYNKIFVYSSFITPLFLGIIAGSTVTEKINPNANNFLDAYIFSWVNGFSFAVGFSFPYNSRQSDRYGLKD